MKPRTLSALAAIALSLLCCTARATDTIEVAGVTYSISTSLELWQGHPADGWPDHTYLDPETELAIGQPYTIYVKVCNVGQGAIEQLEWTPAFASDTHIDPIFPMKFCPTYWGEFIAAGEVANERFHDFTVEGCAQVLSRAGCSRLRSEAELIVSWSAPAEVPTAGSLGLLVLGLAIVGFGLSALGGTEP